MTTLSDNPQHTALAATILERLMERLALASEQLRANTAMQGMGGAMASYTLGHPLLGELRVYVNVSVSDAGRPARSAALEAWRYERTLRQIAEGNDEHARLAHEALA